MARKLRLSRLLKIVHHFQSGQLLNADDLAARVQVSRRTIFRDLRLLNEAGFATLYDEARGGYFSPSHWKLPDDPISTAEAVSLLLICQQLGRPQGGMPFLASAQAAARKISQTLPPELRAFAQQAVEGIEIRLEPRNSLEGSAEFYEQLLEAWIQRRQTRIEYWSATERRPIATLLCPYRLFFSRRSWYVVGRSSRDRAVRMFNIGRILSLKMLDGVYVIPQRFQLRRYLGNAWHLVRDTSQRHEIEILFQPLVARNVAEVSWHHTQRCEWLPDGCLRFRVTVDGLGEISWWILGYGDQAEVVRPEALRSILRERATRMQELYTQQ